MSVALVSVIELYPIWANVGRDECFVCNITIQCETVGTHTAALVVIGLNTPASAQL